MTFSLKNYLLLSALGATALCSCSNEDFDGFGADTEARMVEMTVTLAKGDVDDDNAGSSRTTLVEDKGDLTCLWEASDRVLIATADGAPAGVLSLSEGAGEATATFTGQVDANKINSAAAKTYVYVHYFGTKVDPEAVTTTYTHDFSAQPGTRESLSDYDYFRNTVGITIAGDVLTTNYTAKLSRVTAFGRFHLNFSDGAVLTPDAQVTVTGSFLHTVGNFGLKDQCTFDVPSTNTITTAIDPANGDIWLTILPASAPKTTSLTFTVTAGETTYTGTLDERQWKANEYVRATLDDGSFAGIPVEMTPDKGGDDNGETNEYGEPLNNPLAKWAKGNLYRVDGLTNGILEDETDNGALYQWGRNYGYMDTKGFWETYTALDGSTWDPGEDFTNNIDALGTFEYDGHSRTFDFYITNPQNEFVGTATGFNSNGGYIDVPRKYESLTELQANPDKYYMDFGTKTGDYWLKSFGDGGSTWEARATACGYEQANPCPEGWRIPTMKEFKEITPQVNKEGTSTLTNLLMNSAELRETEEGVRYVIRWNNRNTYIEIQSLVVDNSFTESNISTIIWDNNPSVVTRIFPFTGNINDLIGYDRYLGVYYARPYHRGVVDAGIFSDYSYNMWTIIGPGGNCGDGLGAYWIADAKQAFKFIDKGINPSYEKTSCLLIEAGDPEMGYAIRPVRDYSK